MTMFSLFAKLRKPKKFELARASYGPEPYRIASDISASERAEAVMEGTIKTLLRDVLGFEALQRLPESQYEQTFKTLFPISKKDLLNRVRECGLPHRMATYSTPDGPGDWIFQNNVEWIVASIDDRHSRFDESYKTKLEAEMHVLKIWLPLFSNLLNRSE